MNGLAFALRCMRLRRIYRRRRQSFEAAHPVNEKMMLTATTKNIRTTFEMIKIEHTLFALPFAFLGAVLAAGGLPTLRQILRITLAMFGALSTAMAFNRIVDRDFDAQNPRTRARAIPAGMLSVGFVWAFTLLSAALFFLSAAM